MALKKTIKTTGGLSLLVWLVIGQMLFLGKGVQAGNNGQLSGFNTTQPYLIYYGNWTVGQVDYARTNYHPSGLSIGSEMMVESGTGYDERNGSFYAGTINGLGWTLSPSGTGTNFEVRISRQAQYLLQTSPDLLSWNTTSFIQVSATDNGDGTSLITLRLQTPITDAPGQFVRIAIQR